MDRFMPKMRRGIPPEELEDAGAERTGRQDIEHLRRMLPGYDIDWYMETGEYRLLGEN